MELNGMKIESNLILVDSVEFQLNSSEHGKKQIVRFAGLLYEVASS